MFCFVCFFLKDIKKLSYKNFTNGSRNKSLPDYIGNASFGTILIQLNHTFTIRQRCPFLHFKEYTKT